MINHIWSVLCERSILDEDTKLISMINVIEEIKVPDQPAPDKALAVLVNLVTLWTRSDIKTPGLGYAQYNFTSPGGEVLHSIKQNVDLTKFERLRSRGQFAGLKLPEAGIYSFQVEFRENKQDEWSKVASIPLKVSFKKKQKAWNLYKRQMQLLTFLQLKIISLT